MEPYFTPKLRRLVILGFRIGQTIGSHPYQYNKNTGKFEMVKGAKLLRWYLNATYTFVHLGFILCRVIQLNLSKEPVSAETEVLTQFAFALFGIPASYQLVYFTVGKDLTILANGWVKFVKEFSPSARGVYYGTTGKTKKLREIFVCELLIDGSLYWFPSAIPSMAIFNFVLPQIPAFLSSLVGDSQSPYALPLTILSAIIVFYQMCIFVSGTLLLLSLMGTVSAGLLAALTHLRLAEEKVERWPLDMRTYMQIRLLGGSVNRCYTLLATLLEILCIVISVFGVFGALRLNGVIRMAVISIGLMNYLGICAILRGLAEYDDRSRQLLEHWSRCNLGGWERKSFRAFRPIRINIFGGFIDIPIILTVTDVVISNAVAVLMV